MLEFDRGEYRLNCRSVALIVHDNHVLIHRAEGDDFWALPGGRMEFGETSNCTVVREIREELSLECSVVRPLWYVENFFEYLSKKYHELSTFYLVSLGDNYALPAQREFRGTEIESNVIFKWLHIEKLSQVNLQPSFIKRRIHNLPETVEFIYHRNDEV